MEMNVTGLGCQRGGVAILEGVDFRLAAGQVLILRGPNGIGKTTLLRTIAGLQPPIAGRVDLTPEAIAYGGHSDGLKAMLTVAENLGFWAGIYGTSRIAAALEAFELGDLAGRPARNLSAGQKRRLGLARLLVTGRPVWLLDEPTVSLDRASVALFGEMLVRHVTAGGSALIATHIDLGLTADELDLTPNKAGSGAASPDFDEAFL